MKEIFFRPFCCYFFSVYSLNALQSDNNSNGVYVLGHKYTRACIACRPQRSKKLSMPSQLVPGVFLILMRRSNRNFNILPRANPGHLTISCARGVGNFILPRANPGHLTISCARGVGNLTVTSVEWGKLNQKCQASSGFLFRAPKSLIAINTCLDEMEEFKGRD